MRSPLALLLLLVIVGSPVRAEPRLSGVPARVAAGAELDVAWSGLAARAHEVELELSLAGGRWVRISPELEARDGHFAWRVPPGLGGLARLRLRIGGDGFESAAAVSPEFAIEAHVDRSSPWLGALASASGDWWGLCRGTGAAGSGRLAASAVFVPGGLAAAVALDPVRSARAARRPAALACARTTPAPRTTRPWPPAVAIRLQPLRI